MISAFFWIPAIIESKYTNAQLFIGDFYKNNFLSLIDTIYSRWGFGAEVNSVDGFAPQIGIVYFIFVIFFISIVFTKRKFKRFFLFWGGVLLLGIFLSISFSKIIWENVSDLKLFQFPWRMIILSTFAAAFIVSTGLNSIKSKKAVVLILLFFVLSTVPFIQTRKNINLPDNFYYNFPGTTYYHGEASTIWSAGDASSIPQERIQIVEGEGKIKEVFRKSHIHKYHLVAKNDTNIVDNTFYFPGWRVYINDTEQQIQFQDPQYRGLITFQVPKGEHEVTVVFEETKVRLISNIITIVGLFLIMVIVLTRKYFKRIIT